MHGEGDIVVDVGGDPTGARVLGGLKDALRPGARGFCLERHEAVFQDSGRSRRSRGSGYVLGRSFLPEDWSLTPIWRLTQVSTFHPV